MILFMALPDYEPMKKPVTAALRAHWGHFVRVLAQAQHILTRLPKLPPEELETELYILDNFFTEGVLEHLDSETRALFSVADRFEPDELPITTALRLENACLHELTAIFHRQIQRQEKDLATIQGIGDNLLHIMQAHLREEEAVLFPYLDTRLSESEVEELLVRPMLDHIYDTDPAHHHLSAHLNIRFRRPTT